MDLREATGNLVSQVPAELPDRMFMGKQHVFVTIFYPVNVMQYSCPK